MPLNACLATDPIVEKIEASLVPQKGRLDFLPQTFRNIFVGLQFESLCFDFAKKFSNDYIGGHWEFWKLSNGVGFIALNKEMKFNATNTMNYSECEFNGFEYGIVCSLFALNYLMSLQKIQANDQVCQRLVKIYHGILNYVAEMEDNSRILEFID